ncbi:MAG: DUF1508 domain-containing protein [Pseudorhizobium pelagicum]|uniref:DUF1508 domain-containing protein n=1 Tax=Pseudorhizobium pelagicum TaxID=1509405 RepID=UPI003460DF84
MIEIRPIRSEADYENALQAVKSLWGSALATAEGDRLDVLVTLIDAYENEHFPMDTPGADALAAFEQEQKDLHAAEAVGHVTFEIVKDETGRFAFHLTKRSGEIIFTSEGFDRKDDAIAAIRVLQESASKSDIVDLAA